MSTTSNYRFRITEKGGKHFYVIYHGNWRVAESTGKATREAAIAAATASILVYEAMPKVPRRRRR